MWINFSWSSLTNELISVVLVFAMRLHVMQHTVMRRPFCPSVCLSLKRVHCDKTKETYAHIFIPHERTFILVFRHEEWLVGADPLYLKFWDKVTPFEQNANFQSIFDRSASAITPSEKVQLTLIAMGWGLGRGLSPSSEIFEFISLEMAYVRPAVFLMHSACNTRI